MNLEKAKHSLNQQLDEIVVRTSTNENYKSNSLIHTTEEDEEKTISALYNY